MFLPISAIIPVLDRPLMLREAISSILKGSYLPQELIIVLSPIIKNTNLSYPDKLSVGSFLEYKNIKSQWGEKISKIQNKILFCKKPGVAIARNYGVSKAKNPWIAFLDSDDLWEISKLEKQWQYLQQRPQLKACHSRETWIKFGKELKQPSHLQPRRGRFLKAAFEHCLISCSSLLIKKETFYECGTFPESFMVCEDYYFFLHYLKNHPIGFVNNSLVIKRSGNWSQLSRSNNSIDIWRAKAIIKFVHQIKNNLTESEKKIALNTANRKLNIVEKGAKKRQGPDSLDKIIKIKALKEKIKKIL